MIAMQYRFALPADYDMAIIRHRIASKGHLMDGFPDLLFKAYLYAEQQYGSCENLYAPFYLWRNTEGINAFLTAPGFQALTQSFGWPGIRTWLPWFERRMPAFAETQSATRELITLPPHCDLPARREAEIQLAEDDLGKGALAVFTGYEPTTWSLVRFRLWMRAQPRADANRQAYRVGHLSLSDASSP